MRIKLNSVLVDDQDKALNFYTKVLGFVPSQDIPVGEFRWITVRSPEGGDTEVALEPNANPAAKTYQAALFEQGIPLTAFEVDDVSCGARPTAPARCAVYDAANRSRADNACGVLGYLRQSHPDLSAAIPLT